ncbi:hypothetical protein B0A58_11785 [Flavobacterium branchiophilum NBRC 15030 = ATCC 35035]|uniref:Uncharacterized protein n=2 Tax=Flavobacterium branchiophilum TaxID=55197 RepID=A0A543G3E1_9FLAO|nr:hypothetical protein [Flavobacterium branchiophilum]OXA73344.1 hypothetical protein B0A58_11785 [Flavobacterium branchiophilum NBRC 15030 = ATCC 35035]TQM40591.1 hypothetical protein BC670_1488 [Flavobacterium branchiophilum]
MIEETRKLIASYKNKFIKYQNDNYRNVILIGNELKKYPKDIETFNANREEHEKEIALEKERVEKKALEAKQKAEANRIKQMEVDRFANFIKERKDRLRTFTNPDVYTNNEIGNMSTEEFNELLNKSIIENKQKLEEEQNKLNVESIRLEKLGESKSYVAFNDLICCF